MYNYTSDSVADIPRRLLKAIYGAGNDKSIGTAAPSDTIGRAEAMGIVGPSRMITLTTEGNAGAADATVKLYLWHPQAKKWYTGGANDNDSTKIYKEKSWGGWRAPIGAAYFFSASIEIATAYVDDIAAPQGSRQI